MIFEDHYPTGVLKMQKLKLGKIYTKERKI